MIKCHILYALCKENLVVDKWLGLKGLMTYLHQLKQVVGEELLFLLKKKMQV